MLVKCRKECFNYRMDSKHIIEKLGGTVEVARLCGGITPQAVSQWHGKDPETGEDRFIPPARLMYLKVIRPDVFEDVSIQEKEAA